MRFPYAYEGIKRVFTGQILNLIAVACTILGGLVGGIGAVAGSLATGLGGGVFLIGSLVLSILSLIFILIGLHRASKDEAAFKPAFIMSLLSLILTVVLAIISVFDPTRVVNGISKLVSLVLGILVIAYVFKGIENLAVKMEREDMVSSGKKIMVLLWIAYGVSIFCSLLSLLFPYAAGLLGVLNILSFLASIAMIVGFILYLVHLSKAKNMLAA